MSRIYLSPPDVGDLEATYALDALRSGWVAPLGPHVDAFEREMAARTGVEHAVALSSGTAALHLALVGWGVGPGDVVVTSTMTFAATANAVVYTGAEPFFVDCDPETGNLDVDLLEQAMVMLAEDGQNVPVVLPVDLLGRCADHHAIDAIARRFGARVLVDAAEALGATYAGHPAGSFGDAAAFSFNGNKIMTTSGGGMLMTSDAALANRARYLSTQARQPVAHYEHTEVGYNYRLSNVLAAIGRAQLSRLDNMIARRRQVRARYEAFFAHRPGVRLLGAGDVGDSCWLTALIVDPLIAGWTTSDLLAVLDAADIEARPVWKPMHLQPVFEKCAALVNGSAEALFDRGIALPSGSALSDDDLDRVLATMDAWLPS